MFRIKMFVYVFVTFAILPILNFGLEFADYNSPIQNLKSAIINSQYANAAELSSYQLDLDGIEGLEDELSILAEERSVTIASKMKEDISKAPSIVTVITAKEIENMGARTITDILRIVPGIDIIKTAESGVKNVSARGIRSTRSAKIKVLIDGHSINMPFTGDAFLFFDDLPLKNVKKIEIIRGPGSALYGANAFLAVINVITKDAEDIDGINISSGFGSFDTQEYSISFGTNLHGINIVGFADYYNTNGLSDTIKEDALFGLPFFGRFSLAPGDTDDSRNELDLSLKLSYKDLELNAMYMNKDQEPFVGPSFVLTNQSDQFFNYVMGDLRYKYELWGKLTLRPKIYYDQYDMEFSLQPFPEGFTIPFDLDGDGDIETWPDGMIGNVFVTNRRLGGEIQADYELFENNLLTFGFNYEWERQDNIRTFGNLDTSTGAARDSIVNGSSVGQEWIREFTRQIWAIYIQNKWDVTNNIGLTIGIRHDHYSDFEGTTNPRIGLVWNFAGDATLKILYGQAFRAPSFLELFTINNPAILGNPDLDPETIRTYELGIGYRFTDNFSANVNYFFNVIRDEIGLLPKSSPREPARFANLGGPNVQGIELEVKADFPGLWNGVYAFANYSYLDAESKGDPLPDVPKHKGNIGINAGITRYLNANLHTFISGSRVRAEADQRDDSPGYALMNLTLTAKDFFKGFKVKASLFNLLDKDYNDPAPINTIPTDIPRPGRTFFIELEYEW
ncbi:MAG: TonB-dependent receptor plug domain-containing protein [Candidatus Anammoxibacter sp.]